MKTVLIIEDEEALAKLYQKSVSDPNVKFLLARDGLEGIAIAKKEKPDLIVTDIMMPRMNGIQVLEAVKKDPELASTPVVMLSNLTLEEDTKKAKEKGALEFWSKRDMPPSLIVSKIFEAFAGLICMSQELIHIYSVEPSKLLTDSNMLDALALCYCHTFTKEESGFDENHDPNDVKARILEHTDARGERNAKADLIIATVPYDEQRHTFENGYLPIMIDEVPHAVVGLLYDMGESDYPVISEEIKSTATTFVPEQQKIEIEKAVDIGLRPLKEKENIKEEILYIPEVAIRKKYRGLDDGFFRMVAQMAENVEARKVLKQFIFWTDEDSPMYGIMKLVLKGKVLYTLSGVQGRVLMGGDVPRTHRLLSKYKKINHDRRDKSI